MYRVFAEPSVAAYASYLHSLGIIISKIVCQDTLNLFEKKNLLLADSEIHYTSDKIHIHRWPKDSPVWSDSIQKELEFINNNTEKKHITINEKTLQIENFKFTSLRKIGISVPFFKKQCTIIFEAQFGNLFAHIHITIKSENYVNIFNQLISWKLEFFPKDS